LAEEGFVLLKNDENALPLRNASKGSERLMVIGNSLHGLLSSNGTELSQNQ